MPELPLIAGLTFIGSLGLLAAAAGAVLIAVALAVSRPRYFWIGMGLWAPGMLVSLVGAVMGVWGPFAAALIMLGGAVLIGYLIARFARRPKP